MPIIFHLDPGGAFIQVHHHGEVDRQELHAFYRSLMADPVAMELRRSLADVTDSRFNLHGSDFAEAMEQIVKPALGERTWRAAVLVANPFQFGTARQFSAHAFHFVESRIFQDRDEALRWLLA